MTNALRLRAWPCGAPSQSQGRPHSGPRRPQRKVQGLRNRRPSRAPNPEAKFRVWLQTGSFNVFKGKARDGAAVRAEHLGSARLTHKNGIKLDTSWAPDATAYKGARREGGGLVAAAVGTILSFLDPQYICDSV